MSELLQSAIDNLSIEDVFLRKSLISIKDDFDPKYNRDLDSLDMQFKHLVRKHEVLKLENESQELQVFRVHVELGARWVYVADNVKDQSDGADIFARIEATMVAEYRMLSNPGQEALEIFALCNVSYHVWPYWREYLMSQAMRMNFPKTVLPIVQFATNSSRSLIDKTIKQDYMCDTK